MLWDSSVESAKCGRTRDVVVAVTVRNGTGIQAVLCVPACGTREDPCLKSPVIEACLK